MAAFSLIEEAYRTPAATPYTPPASSVFMDAAWPRGKVLTEREAWDAAAALVPDRCDPLDPAATAQLVLHQWEFDGLICRAPDFPGAWMRPLEDIPRPAPRTEDAEPAGGTIVTFGERRARIVYVVAEDGERIPLRVWFDVPEYSGPRSGYAAHLAAAREASRNPTDPAILD